MSGDPENLAGLILYFLAVVGLVMLIMVLSHLLGQRRHDKATLEPFESGVVSVGDAQLRFSAPFFLVAIFFVIFDLEAVFLFAWVIGFRESGLAGLIEAAIFIAVLLAGLAYLWKLGALDWRKAGARLPHGQAAARQATAPKPAAAKNTVSKTNVSKTNVSKTNVSKTNASKTNGEDPCAGA